MNEQTKKLMQEMSGETQRAPKLELNEIILNGKTGTFYKVNKLKGLIEKDGKKSFEKQDIGSIIEVIFIRIRRKLRMFRKGEKALSTNEHNSKQDLLTLFGDSEIIKGSNDELRQRFTGLKTNQIVYCLLKNKDNSWELCRLIVKGASLGSENKKEDVLDFYSYISSFKGEDHFYNFVTVLSGIEETSPLGDYHCISYTRGNKLEDKTLEGVAEQMKVVHEFTLQSDNYYQTKKVEDINKEVKEMDTIDYGDGIDYGDEISDPDLIPFN